MEHWLCSSPVDIGFGQDGLQTLVELEESHDLERYGNNREISYRRDIPTGIKVCILWMTNESLAFSSRGTRRIGFIPILK